MTWPINYGAPYGGALPTVQVDSLSITRAFVGDTVVVFGSGFSPGTQVFLNPGNILIGTSLPTVTDEITVTIPFGIPNIRHVITVNNDTSSDTISIFVIRDVSFSSPTGQTIDVLSGELNST